MTFLTKLHGDWADLDVHVTAKEIDGEFHITRVTVPSFGRHDIFVLLSRSCVHRLKREAQHKRTFRRVRMGIFTEDEGA